MIEKLKRADFEAHAQELALEWQGQRLALALKDVRDLPPNSLREEPFAVTLVGPASPMVPQGIHALLHPVHGRLDLFIVPIGRDAGGVRYEIIFN